jgi:tripartite-type tricarboxylate transporter receptor subunit TctC
MRLSVRPALAVAMLLLAAPVLGQAYPARPVRFVVPLSAGGAGDIVARAVAARLSEQWGQQVLIDNRAGANTIIGTELVAKAKPDGYTWLLGVQGSLALNPVYYAKLPYDAVADFDPVTQLTRYGYILVVPPSLPVRSVRELVALAKARPGAMTYGTSGTGGSNHLAGESFRLATGTDLTPVAYKGSAPALTALLSGEITMMFDTLITSIPQVKAGRIRALAVTQTTRVKALPDVPTVAEAGVKDYRFEAWQSIVVPAGTDKAIVAKIQADTAKVLAQPEVRRALADDGANELVGGTPEELARLIRTDIERYRVLLKAAGIQPQ